MERALQPSRWLLSAQRWSANSGWRAPFSGDSVSNGRYTNIGPRFGFAYSLDSKTVLRRGGVGIFYAFENNTSNVNQAVNAPFHGSLVQNNSSTNHRQALPISAGYPAGRPDPLPHRRNELRLLSAQLQKPSANEFNLNLQRQLSSHDVFSIAYVGQTGIHIFATPNINLVVPGPGAVANRRPYPNLADGTSLCPCGNSSYHSLQTSYIYTSSNGLHLQGAYTYSHSLDDTSGTGALVAMQNPNNFASCYGNSDFNLRHSLVLSQTYDLPFGRRKKFLNSGGLMDLLNILFGPGTKQVDLSVFKSIRFNRDSRYLQFRAEAFNILNTPQFNNPNA